MSTSLFTKGGVLVEKLKHLKAGNLVANTLDYYRERINSKTSDTPEAYVRIKKRLQKIKSRNNRVLMDIKESYSVQTVVVELEEVYDRWAKGSSICYLEGEEVKVPYTIHYSDIYCKIFNIKFIEEGENPIGKRLG